MSVQKLISNHKTVQTVLGGAVASGGTFVVAYPDGTSARDFNGGGSNHAVYANAGKYTVADGKITVAFTTVITVTWLGGYTLAAGTEVNLQLERYGEKLPVDLDDAVEGITPLGLHLIDLGVPAAPSTTGVFTAQLLGAAGDFTLASPVTFDVPRNFTLTVATTNHSGRTITVYGTDVYGNVMVESLAGPNNNTVSGKKAFKTITRVASDGAIATNGIAVGFGDVLGLPFFVPNQAFVLKAMVDGADEVANATVVGGLASAASTATSADVRGTIDFNTASNGTRVFQAIVAGGNKAKGMPQYAG